MTRPLFSTLSFAFLAACGSKHTGTFDVGEATVEGDASAATATADGLWSERGDEAKLREAIAAYESVLAIDPANRHALLHLARGYYFLGDGHLTADADKQAAWDQAIIYGKQCMGLNAEFKAATEGGEADEETAAQTLTKDDVECTYWTATALGKWAGLQSLGVKIKNIPSVKAWIGRVEALDNTYYYAATDRYWGAYYAAIPSFAGRDLDMSRSYLDKAIEAEPMHFGNRILLAEYWAEKTQDVATFDEQIAFVLNNCHDTLEDIVAEQEAEQRKAQALLDRRSELFIDAGTVEAPEIQAPDCTPAEPAAEEAAAQDAGEEGAEEVTEEAEGSDSAESAEESGAEEATESAE